MSLTLQLPGVVDYQHKALFGPERYAVVEGATKVGKTYPALVWLLSEAGRAPRSGRAFWWIAPTIKQAEMAYERVKRMMRKADPPSAHWKCQDQKRCITVNGLGEFWFMTGDDPDNLYGEDVYGVVMDEFTRQREGAWHAVRSTLTSTGGRCRFIGNVRGKKNWGWNLARRAESGVPGMSYSKITWKDAVQAGILPQSEVDDAKATLPEHVFRELYEAEASDDGSNPFGMAHIEGCVGPMGLGPPVVFGIDLANKADYTVVIGLNAAGQVCIFDRWHGTGWDNIESRISNLIGDVPAWIDSTGVGEPIVERLGRTHPGVQGYKFTSPSKQLLMVRLALFIQQRKVTYPDGPIKSELETFEYELIRAGAGVRYSAPDGLNDDCVCALALACMGIEANANTPSFSFGVVGATEKVDRAWGDDW